MKSFIPVKITDKKYADRLLDGEIFMQPLFNFGLMNRDNIKPNNDSFRHDLAEGTSRIYQKKTLEKMPFFNGFEKDFQNAVHSISDIDTGDVQYFKLFCQYCLEFDTESKLFVPPDNRISQFGNYAVVILDYNAFLKRIIKYVYNNISEYSVILLDRVKFYRDYDDRPVNPLFEKNCRFAYQNELRLAIGLTNENYQLVLGTSNLILQIGSIRDIAISVPIYRLITPEFLNTFNFSFSLLPGDEKNLYNSIVEMTEKSMDNYKPGPSLKTCQIILT